MEGETVRELSERIAVLETKHDTTISELKDIKDQLRELLELKAKGVGAFWLVGLILGSGVMAVIGGIISFFNSRPHL
jgi:hypothetical protein